MLCHLCVCAYVCSYPQIEQIICIQQPWMARTRLLRYLQLFEAVLAARPSLRQALLEYSTYSALILAVLAKGRYQGGQSAQCLLTGKPLFSLLSEFYSGCESPFPALATASSIHVVCLSACVTWRACLLVSRATNTQVGGKSSHSWAWQS